MERFSVTVMVCLFGASLSLPIYQPQIGILASNSNEILRLNGLTLTGVGFGQTQMQASPFIPQYVLRQQSEQGLPQILNFNPQMGAPFGPQGPQMMIPTQGNQMPPLLYANGQQDQPQDPNNPNNGNNPNQPQNPSQGVPQYPQYFPSFSFPQQPRIQGYPYYMHVGYPQRNPQVVMQPNSNPQINNGPIQQNWGMPTQVPQLPQQNAARPQAPGNTWPKGVQTEAAKQPPDQRGDTADTGIDEGRPNFSFLFEP